MYRGKAARLWKEDRKQEERRGSTKTGYDLLRHTLVTHFLPLDTASKSLLTLTSMNEPITEASIPMSQSFQDQAFHSPHPTTTKLGSVE